MFLTPADEVEVSRVVASCKNKLSTDANELSMYIIKRIIATIVTPITHICNLSFKNGVFPDKMKTAKIIPIFKSGDREKIAQTTGQSHYFLRFPKYSKNSSTGD